MMEMEKKDRVQEVVAPEDIYPINSKSDRLKVFLAGGITGCPDWQSEFTEKLRKKELERGIYLFNPRRPEFDVDNKAMEQEQIAWEYKALAEVDITIFWFSEGGQNMITLYELGMWANSRSRPAVVGVHPDYIRAVDVRTQTQLAKGNKIPMSETIDGLVNAATRAINLYEKPNEKNRCMTCRYFKTRKSPALTWEERRRLIEEEHPDMKNDWVGFLADKEDIGGLDESDYGKCTNVKLPELRENEFYGKDFGCIYHKK